MLLSQCRSALARSAAAAAAANAARAASSSTYDHRRLAARRGWKHVDPEAEEVVFPNERLGNNIQVNWAYNNLEVIPVGESYRNLHARGLQMVSPLPVSRVSRASELRVAALSQSVPVFALDGVGGDRALSIDQFRQLFRQMRKYLSSGRALFMNDGALGSDRAVGLTARVVSDSAVASHFLHHTLGRVPLGNPLDFHHDLTAYVCEGLQLEDAAAAGVPADRPFVAVDYKRRNVVVGNPESPLQVQDALARAFAHLAQADGRDVAVVNADARVLPDGATALVFGGGSGFGGVEGLYSAGHTLLHAGGVSRLWDGVTSAHVAPSRGDLVQTVGKEAPLTTTSVRPLGNSRAAPTAVVVVVAAGKGVPAVSSAKAAAALKLVKGAPKLDGVAAAFIVNKDAVAPGESVFTKAALEQAKPISAEKLKGL